MAEFGFCDWPVVYQNGEGGDEGYWASTDDETRDRWERVAVDYLRRWSGQQFGLCESVVRPCRQDCPGAGASTFLGPGVLGSVGAPWTPVLSGGQWLNVGCGSCLGPCACTHVASLRLDGPVDSIISITLDGNTLPPTAYRVEDHRYLIRHDGGEWPICQDYAAETGEGVFEIRYRRGLPVPLGGQIAAGILAIEFSKAANRDKTCQLPQRLSSITRQGVTIDVLDTFDDIDTGHTGIWLVDSWVASVTQPRNTRSRVYSPDLQPARPRRTTWTGTP